MRGQFNKTSMLIANINILVMISDQEFPFPTINFSLLQGDFQKSVVAPIGASMGFNCHKKGAPIIGAIKGLIRVMTVVLTCVVTPYKK